MQGWSQSDTQVPRSDDTPDQHPLGWWFEVWFTAGFLIPIFGLVFGAFLRVLRIGQNIWMWSPAALTVTITLIVLIRAIHPVQPLTMIEMGQATRDGNLGTVLGGVAGGLVTIGTGVVTVDYIATAIRDIPSLQPVLSSGEVTVLTDILWIAAVIFVGCAVVLIALLLHVETTSD